MKQPIVVQYLQEITWTGEIVSANQQIDLSTPDHVMLLYDRNA